MIENNIISKTCIHGKPKNKPCWFCSDNYIRRDVEKYIIIKKQLQSKKSQKNFELAFELYKNAQRWFKAVKTKNLQEYLKKIRKSQPLLSRESLQMAYKVAKQFPGLKRSSNRKLPFTWYREIANSSLDKIEKEKLYKEIEERYQQENHERIERGQGLSSQEIRDMISEKTNAKQCGSQLPDDLKLIYKTAKGCLRSIKRYLKKKKIPRGTPVIFKINKES